jgi:dihydroorotate dehydrogenase
VIASAAEREGGRRLPRPPIGFYHWLRPLLFTIDPESAHHLTLRALRAIGPRPSILGRVSGAARAAEDSTLALTVAGIRFPNPVGLAAGYDKDAAALPALAALGFGFIEIGTVTPRSQRGNPRPRVRRLPEERGLANALGFPSAGAEAVAARLDALGRDPGWARVRVPIGASLGKMRETPEAETARDLVEVLLRLAPHVDFLVINVSSPNTPGLTGMQAVAPFDALAAAVAAANREEAAARGARPRPLFAKLGPDLDPDLLDEIADVAIARGLAGLVLTNTLAVDRPGLLASPRFGLSGQPICERARAAVAGVRARAGSRLALIGVGGILSPEDATDRLAAGADLVQLYTGLIYEGPALLGRALDAIRGATAAGPRGRPRRPAQASGPDPSLPLE